MCGSSLARSPVAAQKGLLIQERAMFALQVRIRGVAVGSVLNVKPSLDKVDVLVEVSTTPCFKAGPAKQQHILCYGCCVMRTDSLPLSAAATV